MGLPDLQNVLVFGAGGHAKVVIDAAEKQGKFRIEALLDDNPGIKGKNVYGYTVIGGRSEVPDSNIPCVIAIGDNRLRHELADFFRSLGRSLSGPIAHPAVSLARGVVLGKGTVVFAGVAINADTNIGHNTVINTGASIDHDCVIGDSVHIAPGTTLCGGVSVGDLSMIGAGAVICPNVKIGSNVIVGAGATVLDDVADNLTVAGTPAVCLE